MSLLKYFILLLLLLPGREALPQNDADTLQSEPILGLEAHQGFIIIHSRSIREVKNSYPTGVELNMNWQDLSRDAWQTCHCYPQTGLGLSYFNFDNPDVLGNGYIISGYIEPFFQLSENWALSLKAACGLGYLTRPYDPDDNPLNQSYSVHVNGFLQLNFGLNYKIAPHWRLSLAANYNHLSNGGIEKPNKGINFPTATIGVDYLMKAQDFPDREQTEAEIPRKEKHQWEVNTFLGTKELNNEAESRHWNYGIQAFYNRKVSHLHALRLGGEWVVNNAVRREMKANDQSPGPFKHHRGNLLASHAFLLGRFRFSEQIGVYLFRPYRSEADFYQRYSLTYQMSESLHTGIGFKAHRHVADFLDVRMSWRF